MENRIIKEELREGAGTDLQKWNFNGIKESILEHLKSLEIPLNLEKNLGSPYIFIIDKEKKLRRI